MTVLTIPRHLREKLGEDAADEFVGYPQPGGGFGTAQVIRLSEEKFERRLSEELGKVRVEIADGNAALRVEIADGNAVYGWRLPMQRARTVEIANLEDLRRLRSLGNANFVDSGCEM